MRIFTASENHVPQGPRARAEIKSCIINKEVASLSVDHAARAIDCANWKGVDGLMLSENRADMGAILGKNSGSGVEANGINELRLLENGNWIACLGAL